MIPSVLGTRIQDLSPSAQAATERHANRPASAHEFPLLLNRFQSEVHGSRAPGDLGSAATAIAAAGPATDTAAALVASRAISAGHLPPQSSSLPAIVAYARTNGFPKAALIGGDSIDFGDGHGPAGLIAAHAGSPASWWFSNR